jgi:hypothetical protein
MTNFFLFKSKTIFNLFLYYIGIQLPNYLRYQIHTQLTIILLICLLFCVSQ